MSSVYVVKDGKTEPMNPVLCKDEDNELQTILRNNFDLLPGEQIDSDVPCRWMLIKREMPVPDPSTGTDRWNIDFVFADQNATPTFVECKRYLDTRARREVVGQVLEYAANAQHFWTADDLRAHAECTAKENQSSLEKGIGELQSAFGDSVENFFAEVEKKLKASEIRIIFFLEQAPQELKRLVEFMNSQMGAVDVLLVEAKQYEGNGVRIVVPTVWGFTERIREIKRAASAQQSRLPIATDWQSFGKNAADKGVDEQTIEAMLKIYEACKSLQADISWGRGAKTGSFSPIWPILHSSTAPFSVYSNGKLELHLSSFQNTERSKEFSAAFVAKLHAKGFEVRPDHHNTWYFIQPEDWVPHTDGFVAALCAVLPEYGVAPQNRGLLSEVEAAYEHP